MSSKNIISVATDDDYLIEVAGRYNVVLVKRDQAAVDF